MAALDRLGAWGAKSLCHDSASTNCKRHAKYFVHDVFLLLFLIDWIIIIIVICSIAVKVMEARCDNNAQRRADFGKCTSAIKAKTKAKVMTADDSTAEHVLCCAKKAVFLRSTGCRYIPDLNAVQKLSAMSWKNWWIFIEMKLLLLLCLFYGIFPRKSHWSSRV